MILSHREELVNQPRKYYTCSYGIERAEQHSNGEDVVSASVQTLVRRFDKFAPDEFDMIITDECFPCTVRVDGIPLTELQNGDIIASYNHTTGKVEYKKITHIFKRVPSSMVKVFLSNGEQIPCTPNHPFWVENKGYIPACKLMEGDHVLRLYDMQKRNRSKQLYKTTMETQNGFFEEIRKNLLFHRVLEEISRSSRIKNYGGNKQKICKCTDERTKPDEKARNKRKSVCKTKGNRALPENSMWEWYWIDRATTEFFDCFKRFRTLCRISCSDKTLSRRFWISNLLQNRYCIARRNDSYRNRREQSLCACEEETRRKENKSLGIVRVDSVEICKQTGDGTFGGLCPDCYVYNIEVEGNHNYFVDGILVHNCHHASANTYRKIYEHFRPRLHIGFSASPNRSDGVRLDDIFSKIIFQRDLRWGIENGYLCDIFCKRVNIGYDLSAVHTRMGDYAPGELDKAMDGTADAIAQAYREHAKGATLIFAVSVRHAQEIADRIPDAVVVTGQTKDRAAIIEAFTAGRIPCLVNCMVFTEGTDIPRVETIILARPTQSESLYCLDEKTEILTESGWKKDVQIGERVAAFDIQTGEILFTPTISKVRRKLQNDEYFCSIVGPATDIRVTNKHRMIYRNKQDKSWRIAKADQVASRTSGSYIPVAGNGRFNGVPLSDDEIRFIGWVMTDGCINKSNNAIYISQSSTQPWINEIQKCIEGCGFKYNRVVANSKTQFKRNGDNIVFTVSKGKPRGRDSHLRGWGDLEPYLSKDFSFRLNEMSERQFDILLEVCHLADGHKQKAKDWVQRSYHITKGNKIFLERLQIAALQRGYRANIASYKNSFGNPIYTLHLKKQDFVNVGSSYDGRPQWTKEAHTNEFCWCVQNEIGTLVTRRNGKVAIVGNCQMVGRGLRLYPGKDKLTLIDCVGVTGEASLCTAPSLLGIDMSTIPDSKRDEVQGDLFELPIKAASASDCPESWIRNVEIVNLWAKEQKYQLHDINWFKMPTGEMICSLSDGKKLRIPCPDALGNVQTKTGQTMTMQEALDRVYQWLTENRADERKLWDLKSVKRWGKAEATEGQLRIIRRQCKGFDCEGLTKGQASQIINRLSVNWRGKND